MPQALASALILVDRGLGAALPGQLSSHLSRGNYNVLFASMLGFPYRFAILAIKNDAGWIAAFG